MTDEREHFDGDLGVLIDLAERRGVTEEDLDDHVIDASSLDASAAYNAGVSPVVLDHVSRADAFAALHGDAEQAASAANNEGVDGQVAFLLERLGSGETRRLLLSLGS